MQKIATGIGSFEINCKPKHAKAVNRIQNDFWKDVLITYLTNKTLTTQDEINERNFHKQLLFNNTLIQYKTQVLFFPTWKRQGLERVRDIIHVQEKRLLSLEEIQTYLAPNKANSVFEYNALVNAIPNLWKEWICSGNIDLENREISVCEASQYNQKPKIIKTLLKTKTSKNVSNKAYAYDIWRRKLEFEMCDKVWMLQRLATKETRLRELQWKILHNIYPTNIILQKMKVTETNKCDYCADTIDFSEHFFFQCKFVVSFWKYLENYIVSILGKRVDLSLCNVMFGVHSRELSVKETNFVNHIILIGKMCISITKKTKSTSPLEILFEQQQLLRRTQF